DSPPSLRRAAPRYLAARVRLPPALRMDAADRARPRARAAHAAGHRGNARDPRARVLRRRPSRRRGRPADLPLPGFRPDAGRPRARDAPDAEHAPALALPSLPRDVAGRDGPGSGV